jgi:hypothetical protein
LKPLGKISQKGSGKSGPLDSARTVDSEIGHGKRTYKGFKDHPFDATKKSSAGDCILSLTEEYPHATPHQSSGCNELTSSSKISKRVCLDLPADHPSGHDDTENIKYNTTIQELNLSGNRIGAAGASFLAKGLSGNSTMLHLDVGYQKKGFKIGPEGAHRLADWLGSPTCKLLTFKCARNNIGFEGCRHISSALFRNSRLRELDIGGVNYITIAGALQLGQAIKCNKASHLAWLTVGEHRVPINPLIGRNSYRSSVDHELATLRLLSSGSFAASSSIVMETDAKAPAKDDEIPAEIESVINERETNESPSIEHSGSRQDIHAVHIHRIQTEEAQQYRDKAFVSTTRHGMEDELGVVVATLITHNRTLEYLQIEDAKLPIQKLIGNDSVEFLDLSNMKLNSIDTIIVGSLISENSCLKSINLRGNDFGGTEGENFVAYALERNVDLKLDLASWPAMQMYSDGYPTLAAVLGLSASGVTIEPQRLEGCFYQSLTAISAITFYVGLVSDIITLYQFGSNPEVYDRGWVVLLAVIMCIPTSVYLYNAMRNLICVDPVQALWDSFLILFQILPGLLAYRAVLASMESAPQLDLKFVQATHKAVPQIYFQSFIMFSVGIANGIVNYWSLLSNLSSLLSITVIFIMLFDRKAARRISMAPLSDQPKCAVYVACIFEVFGMGNTSEEVKAFVNFDAFYTAHYCVSYVYQLCGLCPRIIAISWLLACKHVYGIIAIGAAFVVRIVVLLLHDAETYRRSFFNNIIAAISLVLSDSAWHFDPANPDASLDSFLTVSYLSSMEVIMILLYCFLIFEGSKIPSRIEATIFSTMIFGIFLRWLALFGWAVRIHFPLFYVKNRRRGSVFVTTDKSGQASFAFGWNPLKHVPRPNPQ